MEGEDYILSSNLWNAIKRIETATSPVVGDPTVLTDLKTAMRADWYGSRMTLDKSVKDPVNVFMHFTDKRFALFILYF
jgi:hypothetical protein